MNTAGKYRPTLAIIEEHLRGTEKRHTPVSRIKVAKDKKTGIVNIDVFTSRPDAIRVEAGDIQTAIKEASGGKDIKLNVVPEARAVAKFIRMSPRKARLVLNNIKGKRVSDAIDILRFTPNHASEPIMKVLKSAAANALDGWGADPTELKVHNIIADGGPILKRIRARAQGRAYRILKRTTHLTAVLMEAPAPVAKRKPVVKAKKAAAPAPKKVEAPKAEEPAVAIEETTPIVNQVETTPVAATETIETASADTPTAGGSTAEQA
jgi:large subunit ribosomal protein L22